MLSGHILYVLSLGYNLAKNWFLLLKSPLSEHTLANKYFANYISLKPASRNEKFSIIKFKSFFFSLILNETMPYENELQYQRKIYKIRYQ